MNLQHLSIRLLDAYGICVFAQQTYVNVIKFNNVFIVVGKIPYSLIIIIIKSNFVFNSALLYHQASFIVFVLNFESIDMYTFTFYIYLAIVISNFPVLTRVTSPNSTKDIEIHAHI